MTELNELLSSLGLEHQESNIYLASVKLGTSPASILAKRCNIPRSTARYTCEQLVKKQLMIEGQKGNTKLFTAENPEKLQKLLDLQQEQIAMRQQQLDTAMQDLKRLYNPYTFMPKVQFFEGVDGLIKMYEDVLAEGAQMFGALSITEEIDPAIFKYIKEKYRPKRHELGNPAWMLFNDNPESREYQKQDKDMNRTSLLVPTNIYPIRICYHIYGNKVAFYSRNQSDMTGVLIENSNIRDTQMSIFRLAWDQARQFKANNQYKDIELPD